MGKIPESRTSGFSELPSVAFFVNIAQKEAKGFGASIVKQIAGPLTATDMGPYAGQVIHEQRRSPGLPTQPDSGQVETSSTDVELTAVSTNARAAAE